MGSLRPYIDTIQKVSSKQNDEHPRRSIRTSASVDTDICVGRRGCSTTNINIRNETSSYHTKLSPAQPLLSANLQRRIHRRVAVGHEAQHQLAEPAALEPERARLRRQGHHRSLYAAHSEDGRNNHSRLADVLEH